MNHLELKASRIAFGLEVADLAEMLSISKRRIQRYEAGSVKAPQFYKDELHSAGMLFSNMKSFILKDIESFKRENPRLVTDCAKEYAEWVKKRKRLILPFYKDYEDFEKKHNQKTKASWRMYQACVSALYLARDIDGLSDDVELPHDSKIKWFLNDYPALQDC